MREKLTNKVIDSLSIRAEPYEVHDVELKGFLIRIQPTGLKTYYFSYYNESGKRQRYKIGRSSAVSAAQARDIATKLAGRVADSEDVQNKKKGIKAEAERQRVKTLKAFLDGRYEPWAIANKKSAKGNIRSIKNQFGFLMDKPLDGISNWVIEKWRSERKKSGTKTATINRELACLKALLSKAVEWGVINQHPLQKVRPLKMDNNSVVRYLTGEEEKRLRLALSERESIMRRKRASYNVWLKQRHQKPLPEYGLNEYIDHLSPMVILSLNTGLRRGEIFQLAWGDISFNTKTLTVRGESAKSGKTRHIPLNQEALNVLLKWKGTPHKEGLVFPSLDGSPLTDVKKSWAGLMTQASIKNFRWHDMRHHFASRLVMAGVDLNTVRELLGHSSLEMTLRYAHLAPEHKAEAVSRLVVNV